jgi:hypothetical protein
LSFERSEASSAPSGRALGAPAERRRPRRGERRGLLAALGAFGAVLLAPLMLLAVIALVLFVLPALPAHVAATHLPLAGVALAGTTDEVKKLLSDLGATVTEFGRE